MVKGKIRKSLKFSFLDGIFASVMQGIAENYINPYALALQASAREIGLLVSVPGLTTAISQLKAADLTERIGRKKIIKVSIFLQVLTWLPIIFLPYFFLKRGDYLSSSIGWLIFFVTLYALFGNIAAPAWGSIMSQYVPMTRRGSYFAWRNRIFGTVALSSVFLAGFILTLFNRKNLVGFTIIFSLAMFSRFISWIYLTKYYEPRLHPNPDAYFTFWDFIKRIKESNFVKFVLFISLISLAVNLASPFFPYYMLRERNFSYLSYTIIILIPTVVTLLSLSRWGKHADIVGNLRVIKSTAMLVPIIPVLWLFSANKFYLVGIQIFAGFLWAGYNLCITNFIYDAVSPEKRARCLAYFNFLNGLGLFLGATFGGYLLENLPKIFGYRTFSLFLISGLTRGIIVLTFVPKIEEVREVKTISSRDLFFSVIGIKPAVGISADTLRLE
ncbi:MAG TPA: hypothetical protein DHV62_08000 [Elusimicrobia bacterium]|jgi:MFS family permease|nr:hypothetical protein [Elusimicrobiota bacterium]